MENTFITAINDPRLLFTAFWVAELDNKKLVCQENAHTWKNLINYISKYDINIISFYIRYMDNVVKPLPDYANGYFYREASMGIMNGPEFSLMSIGYVTGDKIVSFKYRKPELIRVETDYRNISEAIESTWLKK